MDLRKGGGPISGHTHFILVGWKIKAVPIENGKLEVDSVKDLQLYENLFETDELA